MFTLEELKASLGWREKLALWTLWRWLRRQPMFGIATGWMTKAGAFAGLATALAALLTALSHVLTALSTGDWAGTGAAWPEVLAAASLVAITMQTIGAARKTERLATGELKQEMIAAEKMPPPKVSMR